MFCSNCGQKNNDNAKFCAGCGNPLTSTKSNEMQDNSNVQSGYYPQSGYVQQGYAQQNYTQQNYAQPAYGAAPVNETYHKVPKCTHCGHVGEWKTGPVLRPIDWIIGICFMIFGFVPGLIYLVVVAAIRSNEDRREKICRNCKSKNLFTFNY